jgi:hypothetical protein
MIAVVLVACGVMAVSATMASAEGKCSGGGSHDICFYITPDGNGLYDVHVGIDINIGRLDAEAILAQPREHIDAWAIGDDWFDNAEFRIPLTWIAAGDNGLSAEFDIKVPYAALDEDPGPSDGDELYARVRLYDNRTSTRTFTSGTLSSPFTA